MRMANADAPCCSTDFMSLTVVSSVLAMSIALSSLNLSSFPKRSSYIFHSWVPIISCSIKCSSSWASLCQHFWACILHLAMDDSTLSSSACLKPVSWYLAIQKWSIDPVQSGGPWTSGPCFVLSSPTWKENVAVYYKSLGLHTRHPLNFPQLLLYEMYSSNKRKFKCWY